MFFYRQEEEEEREQQHNTLLPTDVHEPHRGEEGKYVFHNSTFLANNNEQVVLHNCLSCSNSHFGNGTVALSGNGVLHLHGLERE